MSSKEETREVSGRERTYRVLKLTDRGWQVMRQEADAMRQLGFSGDYREGVAAFMDKRTPTFTGQ